METFFEMKTDATADVDEDAFSDVYLGALTDAI